MHRDYPELMLKDGMKNPLYLLSSFSEEGHKLMHIENAMPAWSRN